MKWYPTGFVPANFQNVGKAILIIGLLCIGARLFDAVVNMFDIPNIVLYFGIACLIVAGYLLFVVPKED